MSDILPRHVSSKKETISTFEYVYHCLSDGQDHTSPRDTIHFFSEILKNEKKNASIGEVGTGSSLFSENALITALKDASKHKLETVMFAEYHEFRRYIEILNGKKFDYTLKSLSILWVKSEIEAEIIINKLMNAGFFKQKYDLKSETISVAEIYKPALQLKKGKLK